MLKFSLNLRLAVLIEAVLIKNRVIHGDVKAKRRNEDSTFGGNMDTLKLKTRALIYYDGRIRVGHASSDYLLVVSKSFPSPKHCGQTYG